MFADFRTKIIQFLQEIFKTKFDKQSILKFFIDLEHISLPACSNSGSPQGKKKDILIA